MSIIKQELYIARKSKNKELQVALSKLVFASLNGEGCVAFEVYQSDDDNHEFLVYSEFKDDNAFESHKNLEAYKAFQSLYNELVLKKENIPLMD